MGGASARIAAALSALRWAGPAGSVTIPSLASVYNEFALKKHMDTSVLLQVGRGPARHAEHKRGQHAGLPVA